MDPVLLARLQFALTIMFHYLFPPLTIGMGVVLVYLETRYVLSGDEIYRAATKFWASLFGLNFAVGVATGIVMEFEFGTNWAVYSRFVGDVFGSALAAEGIFAFFMESGFLAIVLFGWERVSKGFHLFATTMVALGSIFSSVWIVVANSWQQTPAGHAIVPVLRDGREWVVNGIAIRRAEIVNFWEMVFNPSSLIRLTHVLIGCFIMGTLFILSISAYYLLKRRHLEFARRSFRGALLFFTLCSILAVVTGHEHARMAYRYQPAKLAAAEGHFKSGPADLILFGAPGPGAYSVKYTLKITGGLSFLLHGDPRQPVVGLDRFREEDRPNVPLVFSAWRVMIGLGTLFVILGLTASYFAYRSTLFEKRWLMWIFVFAVIGGVAANQSGWAFAEVGRQPWVVYPPIRWTASGDVETGGDGYVHYDESQGLRTNAAVSTLVSPGQIKASMFGFGLIYLLLGGVWIYTLHRKIVNGPDLSGLSRLDDLTATRSENAATAIVSHRTSLSR